MTADAVKTSVTAAIYKLMQPDDTILAGTKAMASWLPKWMLAGYLFLVGAGLLAVASATGVNSRLMLLILVAAGSVSMTWLLGYASEQRRRPEPIWLGCSWHCRM